MLEIKLCLDTTALAALCRKIGRVPDASFYAYIAENRGERLAAGLFEVKSERVEPVFYEALDEDDVYLFDGILRAGLNYGGAQGIETGYIPEDFHSRHHQSFAKLNYPDSPSFNIMGFFNKYKNCGPKI